MNKKRKKVCRVKELPHDFMDSVIGYEDLKKLFARSLLSPKQTHILLSGPPASAKSIILLECSRLKGAEYILGYKTTKAGLVSLLFERKPWYLLIDEIEKMPKETLEVLLGLMDPGIVKNVTYYGVEEIQLQTNVYAACNSFDNLAPELLSRFHFKIEVPQYSRDKFLLVSARVLTMLEGVPKELALYIAEQVSVDSLDVRQAIGIARLARTKDDVDELIALQRKYMPWSRKLF